MVGKLDDVTFYLHISYDHHWSLVGYFSFISPAVVCDIAASSNHYRQCYVECEVQVKKPYALGSH